MVVRLWRLLAVALVAVADRVKKTYVYDSVLKKVVEKSTTRRNNSHSVHILSPFTSPIDGTRIRDGAQLAAHNKKHGVTDMRDYSPEFLERKQNERMSLFNKRGKKDRLNDLNRAYETQRELER